MKLTENELNEVLRLHPMWLNGEDNGKRAIDYLIAQAEDNKWPQL